MQTEITLKDISYLYDQTLLITARSIPTVKHSEEIVDVDIQKTIDKYATQSNEDLLVQLNESSDFRESYLIATTIVDNYSISAEKSIKDALKANHYSLLTLIIDPTEDNLKEALIEVNRRKK